MPLPNGVRSRHLVIAKSLPVRSRLPSICHLRGAAGGRGQSRSHQAGTREKPFGESVNVSLPCPALSVTLRWTALPVRRARSPRTPRNDHGEGALACKICHYGPSEMGWVSTILSLHSCRLQQASRICHCEPCGARRGNLAVHARNTGKAFWRIRKCLPSPSRSHLSGTALPEGEPRSLRSTVNDRGREGACKFVHYAPPNGGGSSQHHVHCHPSGCSRLPSLSLRALRTRMAWQSPQYKKRPEQQGKLLANP